jgi:hypothetical protein
MPDITLSIESVTLSSVDRPIVDHLREETELFGFSRVEYLSHVVGTRIAL